MLLSILFLWRKVVVVVSIDNGWVEDLEGLAFRDGTEGSAFGD
jgi:hypothetical protein